MGEIVGLRMIGECVRLPEGQRERVSQPQLIRMVALVSRVKMFVTCYVFATMFSHVQRLAESLATGVYRSLRRSNDSSSLFPQFGNLKSGNVGSAALSTSSCD